MDNFTHGLVGLLAGELGLVARFGSRAPPRGLRGAVLFVSIAGNNTPDLDFVYTGVTGGKLGYLLHHRGHTHTLGGVLPMALIAAAPLLLWAWRNPPRWSRGDWLLVLGLCLLGPVLHVGMDFTNSYGVHPFWPLTSHWHYGDAVFIIEPLLFLSIALVLGFEARLRTTRALLWGAVLVVLGLGWALPYVAWPWALGLSAGALVLSVGARRLGRARRVLLSAGVTLAVLVTFFLASRAARGRAEALLAERAPAATTHELALNPLPANPWCWNVLAVQTEGEDYVVRRAQLAPWPRWVGVAECPSGGETGTTAPLRPVTLAANEEIAFRGEFRAPWAELRELGKTHCGVGAFLRFARAPYFQLEAGRVLVGDLRYDRGQELGFAAMVFDLPPSACPEAVPSWRPPLADLL